jgi:predicted NBD/HSP70 family sugar kinase
VAAGGGEERPSLARLLVAVCRHAVPPASGHDQGNSTSISYAPLDTALARAATATAAPPSARLLPAALAAGDSSAQRILDTAAGSYAHALSHVVHLLNPDVIVLGGGVATIGEPWRSSVARQLDVLLMTPLRPSPPVRLAALGEDVVPVGAALSALGDQSPALRRSEP